MNRRQFVRSALFAGGLGVAAAPAVPRLAPPLGTAATQAGTAARDVRSFGARGGGVADDTDAFERAVERGDGVVHLPRGTYRLTRTVDVPLATCGNTSILGAGNSRVVMAGPGPAFRFVGTHDGTADPTQFEAQVWNRERLPLVAGFEIRGEHPEAVGLRLERTMQATLTALLVRRCRIGIHLVERNRNLLVDHCHVYHNREVGIFFDRVNLHQAILSANHISYNARAGILLVGGDMRNFQLVGNDIEYNHDEKLRGSADVLIDMRDGGSFREGSITGNTIQARPSPEGANVRFLGGKERLVGGLLAVTGNLIGSQTDALHFADCRSLVVSGNSLYSATDRTLALERCANVVIGQNSIDWNPGHGTKRHADGITIDDSDGVTLADTILENSYRGSAEKGGAIEVRRSRDVLVSGCQVLDPRHRGIVLTGCVRCRVSQCHVVDRREKPTLRASIEVDAACRDTVLSDNTVSRGTLSVAPGSTLVRDTLEV